MTCILNEAEIYKIYTWLDTSFFEKLLCDKHNNEGIKVINSSLCCALPIGENYSNLLLRAVLQVQGLNVNEVKLIIKVDLPSVVNNVSDLLDGYNCLAKELFCYETLLPNCHKLLRSVGVNDLLSPEFYPCNKNAIILSDLSVLGFKNSEKYIGLDYDHMVLALTKLAYLHASSAVFIGNNQKLISEIGEGIISESNSTFGATIEAVFNEIADLAKSWPGYENFLGILKDLPKTLVQKIFQAYRNSDKRFMCYNHADIWCNNIMFCYDSNNKAIDCQLVDFGIGYWGTPGYDLSYIWHTSTSDKLTQNHWITLMGHYHDILIKTLDKLKYAGYKPLLADVLLSAEQMSSVAIALTGFVCMVRSLTNGEYSTSNNLLGVNDEASKIRVKHIYNERFKKLFLRHLIKLDNMNLLN